MEYAQKAANTHYTDFSYGSMNTYSLRNVLFCQHIFFVKTY